MGELTTRAATAGDVAAIAAIYAEQVLYGSATFEIVPPEEAEMARRLAEIESAGYPYFVAERDRRVLGYAYAGPYRARPAYRHTVEDSVYIASDSRGLGVGGRLLGQLIAATVAAGFRQMVALIGDSKNTASIRLHKAAGFSDVGTMRSVGYKHGRWLDVVIMQRTLGPGDSSAPTR